MIDRGTNFISTTNLTLAAALYAVNIKPKTDALQIEKPNGKKQFVFLMEDADESGRFVTKDLIKAWNNPKDYIEANPDCPFSYMLAFHSQREGMLDEVKGGKGYIQTTDSGRMAIVNKDASPEEVEKLFK